MAGLPGAPDQRAVPDERAVGGSSYTVVETQDYVVANGDLYILTFAGTAPEFSTILSTFSLT